jgi:hypothetical protein
MSDKDAVVEEKALEYEVMPGADRPEDDDSPALDLSFDEVQAELAEETEEPEEEETVSEDEQSTEEETEEAVEQPDEGTELDDADDEPVAEEKPAKKPSVTSAKKARASLKNRAKR